MKGIFRNTFVRLSAFALLLFFGIMFVTLRLQHNDLLMQAEEVQTQIDEMTEYIDRLQADIDRPFDDAYVTEIAHEKLGLRYPQEIVFYGSSGE